MPAEAKEEEQRQTGLVRAQAARQGDSGAIARAGRITKHGNGQAEAPAVPAPAPATGMHWVRMNDFDWFVQRQLGCGAYLRYVDDFALFGDDRKTLWQWKEALIARLAQERLTIHASEAQVLPTHCGIPWLGFVVYPTHRLLKRRNAVNFTRRLSGNLDAYGAGSISFAELDASVRGWINHVRYADTWGLRKHLFATHPIPGRHAK